MLQKYTAILLLSLSFFAYAQKTEPLKIAIDPSVHYQTIDGFGASDAWRCQFVGANWPIEKKERIADLLFSRQMDESGNPRGIGLSIWRFNITAGTAEQGEDSDIGNPWRRGECFQNSDGGYDWQKQAGQRWFLQAAHDRGVAKFLAFANSPPVHITRNGKGYAEKGVIHLNLRPGKMNDYAIFLADVIGHFDSVGLHFDYLSPINEPQWNWQGHGQEGTPALNEEIYALVKNLSAEFVERKLTTQIVIGEAGTIGHVARIMRDDGRDNQAPFFFNPTSPFYVGDMANVEKTISAHSYHSVWPPKRQVDYRRTLHQALQKANPDLGYWMSEYCILGKNDEIGGGGGRDLGMATALYVARIIHNDLTVANAKSWQWWTAITQVDFKDGLVYLDDGSQGESGRMGGNVAGLQKDGVIRESKLLWTLGAWSRFIRPGMVRIKCEIQPAQSINDGLLASAYTRDGENLVVVLINLSTEEKICDLGLSTTVAVFTTSAEKNLEKSLQTASCIQVPARAAATVVVKE